MFVTNACHSALCSQNDIGIELSKLNHDNAIVGSKTSIKMTNID